MKKIFVLIFSLLTLHTVLNAQQHTTSQLLRHVVMFGWKAGTDTTAINTIVTVFKGLPSKIDLIKSFEYGTNNSPEGLNKGLTHCFLVTFSSEADRDAYIVHPAHKAFVGMLKPAPDSITVLDYWVKE